MRRPPPGVVLVARTHWMVGAVIVLATALLLWLTRHVPRIEFGVRTYVVAGTLAALYIGTGALVWWGAPLGRLLSRVCALLYLPRPNFGSCLWETMNSPEYQAHFAKGKESPANHAKGRESETESGPRDTALK